MYITWLANFAVVTSLFVPTLGHSITATTPVLATPYPKPSVSSIGTYGGLIYLSIYLCHKVIAHMKPMPDYSLLVKWNEFFAIF